MLLCVQSGRCSSRVIPLIGHFGRFNDHFRSFSMQTRSFESKMAKVKCWQLQYKNCLHWDGCNTLQNVCIMPPATFLQQDLQNRIEAPYLWKVKRLFLDSSENIQWKCKHLNCDVDMNSNQTQRFFNIREGNSELFSTFKINSHNVWGTSH